MKTYTELMTLRTFDERYRYLRTLSRVGDETFGSNRWLNQIFYKSPEWLRFRTDIFIRDNACDLAIEGRDIFENGVIHHIEPITVKDILDRNISKLLNPENVITTTYRTHRAIHYGDETFLAVEFTERKPNDTIPWR